jgi:uncharacterized protein
VSLSSGDKQLAAPEPVILPETEPFWAATSQGRLLVPYCTRCGGWIWYPRPLCAACSSTDIEWREHPGRGTIYTFADVRKGFGAFAESDPYVIAYVDLEDGPRILTNIVGAELIELSIGQQVELSWASTASAVALPRFSPVRAG